MRNLSVIKGLYQGNGVTRRWAIPFEYNDKSQIFVTITTYDEGDYTYRVLDSTEYTIDEDSVEIVYPKTDDDTPIPSAQYLTVWRDTDLLQLMDLTNQGAAWPDSIEASLDKLHQIVQELAEGLSRSLKVDIGDPQTPDEKLVAIQDYVLAAAESSRSASASEASAQRAAEAAATSEANAAESERIASGYADTATDAASRAEDSAISARAYNAPDYDNETTYQAGDVVTYSDGNSYRALQETTGNEPPNIIYWQKVTDYVGDDFFEVDEYGYIVPMDSPSHSRYWRVDQNGYIVPIEGGDGGYRPDTRQLSAEYLNVTNEGYVKHLRADDISAQEVDADEMTAEAAAFNTLVANAVNAQSASVTEISAGTLTANDVIAKGPVVDVRAFGAKGDGVTDDTAAIQAAIDAGSVIVFPAGFTYFVASPIYVRSNSKIILMGNIKLRSSISFFSNTPVYAYDGVHDVIFTGGGTIICNDSAADANGATPLRIYHAQNILIENITIKNVYEYHAIEIGSSRYITVKNVTFYNGFKDENDNLGESIQLEICEGSTGQNGGSYYDSTLTHDIVIDECTFDSDGTNNLSIGIGSHSNFDDSTWTKYYYNIDIKNCVFRNMSDRAVSLDYNYKQVNFIGNIVENSKFGFIIDNYFDGVYVKNNVFRNLKASAIRHHANNIVIQSNVFYNCTINNNTTQSADGAIVWNTAAVKNMTIKDNVTYLFGEYEGTPYHIPETSLSNSSLIFINNVIAGIDGLNTTAKNTLTTNINRFVNKSAADESIKIY